MEILRPALNALTSASMKALPKRKGNRLHPLQANCGRAASMKVPPKRKGNAGLEGRGWRFSGASMKALPKGREMPDWKVEAGDFQVPQ